MLDGFDRLGIDIGLVIEVLGFDIGHMVYFKLQLVGQHIVKNEE